MKHLIFSLMFLILFWLPVNKIIAQTCLPPPSGLVAWYPGNGNANDVSVNANNATLQGGATFASGMVQQAFNFNGTTGFASVPSSPANSVTGSFTIDAWVRLNANPPEFAPIASKWFDIGTQRRSYFLAFGSTGRLRFSVGSSTTAYTDVFSSSPVPLNQLIHVAGVFDASTQTTQVYVNGVQVGVRTSVPTSVFVSDEPLLIGAGDLGGNIRDFINGQIDEVDIFNRALTQSEIQSIFNAGSAGKCLSAPTNEFDFDGDGKTDISIFRPSVGEWWYLKSSNGSNFAAAFGTSTDKIVPADFTGDGKSDFAFFRPSNGNWFVLRSEDFSFYAFPFGMTGDVLVPADYDGDGKADTAVFRESTLTWFIQKSSGGTDIIGFGSTGDKPVPSDYDGDGKADIAIFRPNGTTGAEWWIRRSSNNSVIAFQFGTSTDKAVAGDFTGDGKTDIAFWRATNGNWFVLRSEDFSFYAFPFGASGDVPIAGDYDGDGKTDAGVFRPSSNTWFVQRSTAGTLIQTFGIAGDLPVPNAFVP